ncbi:UAA transporter [Dichotomocladium elegans]|nr:UAA transporter [Dichotomocladium elegans]
MLRFTACVAGIYICFLTWGVVQERVSTTPYGDGNKPEKFRFFVFLNLIQSVIAAIVSFLYIKFTGRHLNVTTIPRSLYLKYGQVAFLNCIGSPFGYAALKHIDYPTMILGKSCKLIPVMLMNFLFYRRKFPLYKNICVVLITVGVSMFMLYHNVEDGSSSKKGAATSSLWGLFLLTTNLSIDGLTNATQDEIFHRFGRRVSGQHMMFFMNAIGSVYMALYLVLNPYNNELWRAIQFCQTHPAVVGDVLLFGLCGALGQLFIFYTLQEYGSLRLVTVTVTRKLFTMLLSIFWFDHRLTLGQWFGVLLVFLAIGIEAYIKKQESSKKRAFKESSIDEKKSIAAADKFVAAKAE